MEEETMKIIANIIKHQQYVSSVHRLILRDLHRISCKENIPSLSYLLH